MTSCLYKTLVQLSRPNTLTVSAASAAAAISAIPVALASAVTQSNMGTRDLASRFSPFEFTAATLVLDLTLITARRGSRATAS